MIKTKAITALILASLIATSFGGTPVWGDGGESSETILPQSVRDGLSQRCNVEEIAGVYQEYMNRITAAQMEAQPTPAETAPQPTPDVAQVQVSEEGAEVQLSQLEEEIRVIVEECFTKELENLKCPSEACDVGAFLQQARRVNQDYFLYTLYDAQLSPSNEHADQFYKKVKECLEKLFKDCGCDVECLKCLLNAIFSDKDYVQLANRDGYSSVADFVTDYVTTTGTIGTAVDFPMYTSDTDELAYKIAQKLKECGYQPKKTEISETEKPAEEKEETPSGPPVPTPAGTEEPTEHEEAFKKLDRLLEEAKEGAKEKEEEAGKEPVKDEEAVEVDAEEHFNKLDKLLEDAKELTKETEEEAGDEDESASKLPRVMVMMLSEVGLIEDEGTFGSIDFYTSAPRIDVSMFKAITENTEAEVKVAAVITDESSQMEWDITIEVEGSNVTLRDEGAEAKTTLPLVIKENKLYAGEDDILYPISLLPGEIKAGLEAPSVKINLGYDENRDPVYKILLEEEAKLVFLPLELTREVAVDPTSGEVRNIEQPWWSVLVSKNVIPVKVVPQPTAPQPITPIAETCPCPKLTKYKIRCNYVCMSREWYRDGIVVYVRPPANVKDTCSYKYQIDWGDGSRPYESYIIFPPYTGNDPDPYCTLHGHEYPKKAGNYRLTVKLFNECDERTKTFKVPIHRPECSELVDKSLEDVNFDIEQFLDEANQLDDSSLFTFINQLYPLRNLPGRTVTDPVYGTEAKICHVLVDIRTKGIDPFKTRPKEHISQLVRYHSMFSIFGGSNRLYSRTYEDGEEAAYYQEGKNSAKVIYVPGKEPRFSLTMLFESDCACREEKMRCSTFSNLTIEAEKKATAEAKENLKSDSTATKSYHSVRIVDVLLEICVCCPPGEC